MCSPTTLTAPPTLIATLPAPPPLMPTVLIWSTLVAVTDRPVTVAVAGVTTRWPTSSAAPGCGAWPSRTIEWSVPVAPPVRSIAAPPLVFESWKERPETLTT